MRVLACLLLSAALFGCAPHRARAPALTCPPAPGLAEALAGGVDSIVLDGGEETAAAVRWLACAVALNGRAVIVGATPQAAPALMQPLAALSRPEAAVQIFQFEPPPPPAQAARAEDRDRLNGEARNAAYAAAAQTARGDSGAVLILAVDAPDGAAAPVGLSGHQWRPLGARLPAARTLRLRVEATTSPGYWLKLQPFEDVPARGAAMRYDGVAQIGPAS